VIGILDDVSSDIPIFSLLLKQAVLRGVSVRPARALDEMVRKFEQLQLHPVIDNVYPFADALAAYDHLYRGAFGKNRNSCQAMTTSARAIKKFHLGSDRAGLDHS